MIEEARTCGTAPGLDVRKRSHWARLASRDGEVLMCAPVQNSETACSPRREPTSWSRSTRSATSGPLPYRAPRPQACSRRAWPPAPCATRTGCAASHPRAARPSRRSPTYRTPVTSDAGEAGRAAGLHRRCRQGGRRGEAGCGAAGGVRFRQTIRIPGRRRGPRVRMLARRMGGSRRGDGPPRQGVLVAALRNQGVLPLARGAQNRPRTASGPTIDIRIGSFHIVDQRVPPGRQEAQEPARVLTQPPDQEPEPLRRPLPGVPRRDAEGGRWEADGGDVHHHAGLGPVRSLGRPLETEESASPLGARVSMPCSV